MAHIVRRKIPATKPWKDAGDARKLRPCERFPRSRMRVISEIARLDGGRTAARKAVDTDGDGSYSKSQAHRLIRRAARSWIRKGAE